MIHVAYGTSNLYSKFAATSMLSMFENTNENVTVHILHDNELTVENRENLVYIAGRYNQQIKFYNVEKICATEIAEFKNKFSASMLKQFHIAVTFRLLILNIIPDTIDKIIYLDTDTIVNLDIRELWRVELEDKPLAAVLENPWRLPLPFAICREGVVNSQDYFNVGVLLLNLKILRTDANSIRGGVEYTLKNYGHKDNIVEQHIWNYCFSKYYIKLPLKFNCWVRLERTLGHTKIEKYLYHFIGCGDSLGLNINDNFHRLYWEYFAKTPFFNSESLFKLFNGFRKVYAERQNLIIKISAIMSGKTRAFFTDVQNIDAVKNIFAVQDGEEILTLSPDNSIKNLIDSMTEARGNSIFFLVIFRDEIYNQVKDILKKFEFIENQDFINGKDFLSEIHGVPLNSWEMIKNL